MTQWNELWKKDEMNWEEKNMIRKSAWKSIKSFSVDWIFSTSSTPFFISVSGILSHSLFHSLFYFFHPTTLDWQIWFLLWQWIGHVCDILYKAEPHLSFHHQRKICRTLFNMVFVSLHFASRSILATILLSWLFSQ